jgi:phosphohistidine phosphatase
LGYVASYLLSEAPQPWAIKKAAVWWIRGRNREHPQSATLQAVQSPDCL